MTSLADFGPSLRPGAAAGVLGALDVRTPSSSKGSLTNHTLTFVQDGVLTTGALQAASSDGDRAATLPL